MIIDAHAHLVNEPEYLSNLLEVMDDVGIEKVCLSGLGDLFNCASNNDVQDAIKLHPNHIIGAYYIRPGINDPSEITEAVKHGFKMIKITLPTKEYDSEDYNEYWKIANSFKIPVLFHTGVVTTAKPAPTEKISAWNMHPMRIEAISNRFPDLKMIIAHLGVHWNSDAAELIRMRPNIYADLTGEPTGWRLRADGEGMIKYLWWPHAFKKIVFGTDVHYSKIHQIWDQDHQRVKKYDLNEETTALLFGNTMKTLLNL